MAYLELIRLRKVFGATTAVASFDLEVERGELVAFLGPSGCGKTTTLRMIAGFEQPTEGRIRIDGEDVTDTPPNKRRLGMVFQSYALFPNMTVADNIAFGLRMAKAPPQLIRQRVDEMLALIQMEGYGKRYSHQLSGGQQQRVALARALAIQPRVLLLDEPLSALDAKIRQELRNEIRRIQQTLRITTIYVTHDQEEALALSDRIVVMNAGRIEQVGTPFEIYNRPQTEFVARFVGTLSTLRGVVGADGSIIVGDQAVRLGQPPTDKRPGDAVTIALRPETIALNSMMPGDNRLNATVEGVTFLGSIVRVQLRVNGSAFVADVLNHPNFVPPRAGESVTISFAPEAARVVG
ncbi:MAG: ABC transporter ATP-binding protein [Thermoflexales bacterium]|nr:ABC transporter ATP-binding protein [Thermoflexales bacterium]MDW8351540.1 ABC transporter ATP-binding protein [Anaerolineae bacterium]